MSQVAAPSALSSSQYPTQPLASPHHLAPPVMEAVEAAHAPAGSSLAVPATSPTTFVPPPKRPVPGVTPAPDSETPVVKRVKVEGPTPFVPQGVLDALAASTGLAVAPMEVVMAMEAVATATPTAELSVTTDAPRPEVVKSAGVSGTSSSSGTAPSPPPPIVSAAGAPPASSRGPINEVLAGLQGTLNTQYKFRGLAQLLMFCVYHPLPGRDHEQLYADVTGALQHSNDMRHDLITFEEMLDPTAVYYRSKPSARFPELDDPAFPLREYDEIRFMRHFVAFTVTRLQLIRDLCAETAKERDVVNQHLRAWCQRAGQYL
jgi:hypothetical protein